MRIRRIHSARTLAGRILTTGVLGLGLLGGLLAAPVSDTAVTSGKAATASAACASNTGKSISGTVFGQDGRDVNVSIGFDVVDRYGRALNTDPNSSGYGCRKTGAYSVPQSYLNHFVGPLGQGQNTPMYDASGKYQGYTKRAWRIGNLPSNAVGTYIEVYHRGYQGSPCKDSAGNWCFNPHNTKKYGWSNKHIVPVGTANLPIRLPLTCGYGGTTGNIQGKLYDSAGRPVKVKAIWAWTQTKWNAYPFYQGWGEAVYPRDGYYVIPSLASNQKYAMRIFTTDGRMIERRDIPVSNCKATPLSFRL